MGKIKYTPIVTAFLKKAPVFHISSLKRIIGQKKEYVHLLIHTIVKKGTIFPLTKGWYSTKDDPTLAVFCFKPSYLGLQEALSIHNLWEQETNVIILTTKIVREGPRSLFGENILLRRIPSPLFFGVEYKEYGGIYVPVSDLEKTFLDLLYFEQPFDAELIQTFQQKITKKKLQTYMKSYPKEIQEKAQKLLKNQK